MARGAAEAISGTVMNILHDGSSGQPMRVMIQWTESRGLFKSRGIKSAYVTFEKPQDIKPGDDLHLVARKRPSHSMFQPDQYVVDEDVPVQMRLKHQLQNGAEIRSFGQKIAEKNQRPGLIAAAKSGLFGLFGVKPGDQSHCVVLRPATSCENDDLTWAAGLLEGIPQFGPTFVIEPEEFALREPTGEEQAELRASPKRAEKRIAKRMDKELFEHLRPSLPLALDDQYVHGMVQNRRSMGLNQTVGPIKGAHAHSAPISIIKPYSPYSTGHGFFEGLTGLKSTVFVPKLTIDAKWRHAFTTAHELAHSVDEVFGIRGGHDKAADILKRENFADCFALMAMVQRDGNLDKANILAAWRSMLVVAGNGLDHWTGPAACEAVKRAGELLQSGKLQKMNGLDIAHEAAALTRRMSLTEPQLDDLVRRRAEVLRKYKLPLKTDKDGVTFVNQLDGGHGAVTAIATALKHHPEMFGEWQPIFAAGLELTKNLTLTPKQLRDSSTTRAQAVNLYRADLQNSLEGLTSHRPIQLINLHVAEQQRLAIPKSGHLGKVAQQLASAMEVDAAKMAQMVPINLSPAPSREAARIVRSGVGPGSQWLQQAFAHEPRARIERLIRIMDHEATCWQSFNKNKSDPTLAEQTRKAVLERRALCFAVEQDDAAMSIVNEMRAGPFREAVIEGSENESMGVWSTMDERRLSRAARSGVTGLNRLKPR